jgi:ATP/maltotriose-dependent transcriptional regulator MalT
MGGWTSMLHSDERGLSILCQCYDLRDQIGDCNGVAWAAFNLALSYFGADEYAQSEKYTREALARMTDLRTIKGIVQVTHHLTVLLMLRGELEEARQLTEDKLLLTQHLRYQDGESLLLGVKSILVSLMEGDYVLAERLAEQSKRERKFESYKTQPYEWGHLMSVCGLGDFEEAQRSLFALLEYHLTDSIPTTILLSVLALVADDLGQPEKAVEYLGLALATPVLAHGWMLRWKLFADLRRRLEEELDPDVFQAAEQRGRSLILTDVLTQIVTVSPSVEVSQDALVDPLTDRELDVLRLLADGLSNRDIAERLVLSVGTVKVHTRNIYSKLGVGSRTQAIVRGRELGLLA